MGSDFLGSAKFNEWDGFTKDEAFGWGAAFGNAVIGNRGVFSFQPKRHFLSVAPTRSGKGVSLIIPNLLFYKGSAIIVDPKGENAWVTAKCRRELLGQKTIILDPWGEVNRRYGEKITASKAYKGRDITQNTGILETVSCFNPLSILDPANENYAEDLAYIADALIINQGKDPHWDDSARELVAGLIAFVVETMPEDASLPLVRLMLSKPYEEISKIAKEAQKLGFESVAARKLGRFAVDSKEIASIVSTALTQTAFLDSSTLSENLQASNFSFSELVEGNVTIYLVLPVDKLQTYGRWLRLMVSIGIRTVARNTKILQNPVLFVLDEFGTIGRLSAVAQAYGLMAGLQMCIWAFVQDLVQLKRDYPDDWETFLGNSEVVSFFNVMDQFTAEYLSKMLGTMTQVRISVKSAEARKGDPNYEAMADQHFARDLRQPSEIRTSADNMGYIVGRDDPIVFKKLNYFEDPFFYERARHNPYYRDPKVIAAQKEKEKIINYLDQGNTHIAMKILKEKGYNVEEKTAFLGTSFIVSFGDEEKEKFKADELISKARSMIC